MFIMMTNIMMAKVSPAIGFLSGQISRRRKDINRTVR